MQMCSVINKMEKRYSYLWNFFAVSDAVSFKAVCYICNHTLSYRTTITNLKKHLMTRHPEIQIQPNSVILQDDIAELISRSSESKVSPAIKEANVEKKGEKRHNESSDSSIVKLKKVEPEFPFPRKMNSQTKRHIDNTLLSMFTKDFHTFSLVEGKGFQAFVNALNSQYEIPDKNTIFETMLPEMYEKIKLHVEDALQDGLAVTLSVDVWPTNYETPFVAIKANFLDENFDVMSVLLDCCLFSNQPTIEKLNETLKNVALEWGINQKITLVVSNCSFETVTEEPIHWDYINCVINSINIIVFNSMTHEEYIHSLLMKVHCIVSCYKYNKHATSQLLESQTNLGITPEDLILSKSDPNDWYSVFIMLQRFVDLEDFVKNTLCHLDVPPLTKEEWIICREIVEIIKPFEIFIKSLYEEKYLKSSLAIILSKGLETMLKDLSLKTFHDITHSFLSKCIEEMVEHFNYLHSNNVLLISTFLDPRFKDVIFEPNVKESLKQSIENIVASNITTKEQNISKPEESTMEDNSLSIWKAFQSKASECRPLSNKKNSRASIEIQQYLEDGLLPRNENPMQWWKINGHMYPQLKYLMKQTLATTCTAGSCDLFFSKMSQILHERRSHLTIEEAKLILFINSNQYLMKIND